MGYRYIILLCVIGGDKRNNAGTVFWCVIERGEKEESEKLGIVICTRLNVDIWHLKFSVITMCSDCKI